MEDSGGAAAAACPLTLPTAPAARPAPPCSFEGLVKEDKCHVRGVFKYANGDRYEGEFEENNMSGYGVYVWGAEGSVYRGQVRTGAGVPSSRWGGGMRGGLAGVVCVWGGGK